MMKACTFSWLLSGWILLGCGAPELPQNSSTPAAKATSDAPPATAAAVDEQAKQASAKPSSTEPPQDGVTYFAIDSTPYSFANHSAGGSSLHLSPADGTKFGTAINQNGTIILYVTPADGDPWGLHLRAPNREPFEVKMYPDAVRADVSDENKPWIWLTAGSQGGSDSTGWFRINESEFAPNNKRIDRLSVDFVYIEHNGAKAFGRYRLRATADPKPTADEITTALYGDDVVKKQKAGLELVIDQDIEHGMWMFRRMNGRNPSSMEEFTNGVVKQYPVRLPKLAADKELWYDPVGGQLYIRKVRSATK